jgi:arylsulfatase A-like enzyme
MYWPGCSVAIRGVYPSLWKPFDKDFAPSRRVDQILQWLDLPAAQRPRFLTLYFEQVDHFGHIDGPDSPEVDASMVSIDAALARLVDGLKQRSLFDRIDLVVVSDHGEAATHADLRTWLDDIVPLAELFLARLAGRMALALPELSPGAQDMLRSYSWPGNVRELRNVVERALVMNPAVSVLEEAHLLPQASSTAALVSSLGVTGRMTICWVATRGGSTRPSSSPWAMMSMPMRRVLAPQDVVQACSREPPRPVNWISGQE